MWGLGFRGHSGSMQLENLEPKPQPTGKSMSHHLTVGIKGYHSRGYRNFSRGYIGFRGFPNLGIPFWVSLYRDL